MTFARRARAWVSAALLVCGVSLLAASCTNAGTSLALKACVHVDTSIHLFTQAEHAASAKEARSKAKAATAQLAKALPLAARATSTDPRFNPLMTTLQEIGRTSEANLITALRAQCKAAKNPTSSTFPPPSTPGAAGGGLTSPATPARHP